MFHCQVKRDARASMLFPLFVKARPSFQLELCFYLLASKDNSHSKLVEFILFSN